MSRPARDSDGDEEDCEQDNGGSDGGVGQEVDEGVIHAQGDEDGEGKGMERACQKRA